MPKLAFNRPFNAERLHEELRAALGAKYAFYNANGADIEVTLADGVGADDITTLEAVIANHDPATKSALQRRKEQRAAAIRRLRSLDPSSVTTLATLLPVVRDLVIICLVDELLED